MDYLMSKVFLKNNSDTIKSIARGIREFMPFLRLSIRKWMYHQDWSSNPLTSILHFRMLTLLPRTPHSEIYWYLSFTWNINNHWIIINFNNYLLSSFLFFVVLGFFFIWFIFLLFFLIDIWLLFREKQGTILKRDKRRLCLSIAFNRNKKNSSLREPL